MKAVFLDRDGVLNKDKGHTFKVEDFELLISLNVFNSSIMNDAVYKFKRYEKYGLQGRIKVFHNEQKLF